MNVTDYTNMEIDALELDALLKGYIELQKATATIEMNMKFIKQRIQAELERIGETKFTNNYGEASIITQHRNQFLQTIAKGFLTAEQLERCHESKTITFVKVLSTEAKGNQVF